LRFEEWCFCFFVEIVFVVFVVGVFWEVFFVCLVLGFFWFFLGLNGFFLNLNLLWIFFVFLVECGFIDVVVWMKKFVDCCDFL